MQTFRVRKSYGYRQLLGILEFEILSRHASTVGSFRVYAACMIICLPFIDFHSTKAAPRMESAPAATET
jgi:hypothetical protein